MFNQNDYYKRWYARNKHKEYLRKKRYRKLNKKRTQDYCDWYKRTHKSQLKEWRKFHRIEKKYGISKSEWNSLLIKQRNKCAICRAKLPKDLGKLCTDHCHKSGKVRGIVHSECNLLIGFCKENKTTLQNAIKYIQKHLENKNSLHSIK
jgi:hypothetical protein